MRYCECSYAKVNLHLEVLAKRADGYHDILSLMLRTGLHDLLKLDDLRVFDGEPGMVSVKIEPDGGERDFLLLDIPADENLISKAARAYFSAIGKSAEAVVRLKKNIPVGGGLGGGSADAASMLRLLNKSVGGLDEKGLSAVALSIGADVPFCLYDGAALCEGIGEKIQMIPHLLDCSLLILNDGTYVDTKWAYGAVDESKEYGAVDGEAISRKKKHLTSILKSGDITQLQDICVNDFEEPVFSRFPSVKKLKSALSEGGAEFCIMTGSGSTVIGLFNSHIQAKKVQSHFIDKQVSAWLTEFVRS